MRFLWQEERTFYDLDRRNDVSIHSKQGQTNCLIWQQDDQCPFYLKQKRLQLGHHLERENGFTYHFTCLLLALWLSLSALVSKEELAAQRRPPILSFVGLSLSTDDEYPLRSPRQLNIDVFVGTHRGLLPLNFHLFRYRGVAITG